MGRACSAHGEMRNMCKIFVGKLEGKRHSEEKCVDGRIILKWMLGKYNWRVWIGFIRLRIGASNGLL
jgi:hypothetical protein